MIFWKQEKSIPLSVEMSTEMLKNHNILTIPSSHLKLVAATAFEFLKRSKSNCVFKTQGELQDSGLFFFFSIFLMLNSIQLGAF